MLLRILRIFQDVDRCLWNCIQNLSLTYVKYTYYIGVEETKVRKQVLLATYAGATLTQELLSSLNFLIYLHFYRNTGLDNADIKQLDAYASLLQDFEVGY